MSKKRNQRDHLPYIVISIALLPIILIVLAICFYVLSTFVKTTNVKTIFAKDVPKIAPAIEEYKKLYGYYPNSLKSLDEGLANKYSSVCDGSADQPLGCTSDKYAYSISSNFDEDINDTSPAADCGYIIVISQDAIKGSRIIDRYDKLKNTDNIDCLDFAK